MPRLIFEEHDLDGLLAAARAVIENWESGDLAAAVNKLREETESLSLKNNLWYAVTGWAPMDVEEECGVSEAVAVRWLEDHENSMVEGMVSGGWDIIRYSLETPRDYAAKMGDAEEDDTE